MAELMNTLNDKKLKFYPKKHTYRYGKWALRSVSEWLGSFKPPFKDFDAKAVSKGMSYWHFRKTGEKKTATAIRNEWKAVTEEGTAVHAQIEDYIKFDSGPLNLYKPTLPRAKLGVAEYNKFKSRYSPSSVLCEARIFSLQLKLAGTIDLLMLTDKGAVIIDWKTNRKLRGTVPARETVDEDGYIEITSVFDLDGENVSKYTMQLNTYAYILDKYYGIPIYEIKLVHLTDVEAVVMDIPYMPSMVEELIEKENKQ
jgi:ATP-dependent exoDNAse (exonuclease V) beta subunit